MAEPKAKTIQQKLGFFDEDLKKPMHDDILKWVDSNAEKIIYSLYPNLLDWGKNKVEELKKYSELCIDTTKQSLLSQIEEKEKNITSLNKNIESYREMHSEESDFFKMKIQESETKKDTLSAELEVLKSALNNLDSKRLIDDLPKRNPIIISEKPWEFPVTSQSKSTTGYASSKNIIGFIDIKITFLCTQLTLTGIDFETKMVKDQIKWAQTNRFINYKYGDDKGESKFSVYFEIKTKIPSLGELFRQLRMYQVYVNEEFVIVCPDDNERKLIEEQGYKFVKYK